MQAMDVMVRNVITVKPDDDVAAAVHLMVEHDVSALPVLDEAGKVIGMLSEADLLHREEIATEKHRSWWMEAMTPASRLAEEFAKSHGHKVHEVMTSQVVSVGEDMSLAEVATLLERHRIKRAPVLRDGKLVGIISRTNLVQALATAGTHHGNEGPTDRAIRHDLLDRLEGQKWTHFGSQNVTVRDGVVHLWGMVASEAERKALLALTEEVPGVRGIVDETISGY
jgi:CBS domain-containing protein